MVTYKRVFAFVICLVLIAIVIFSLLITLKRDTGGIMIPKTFKIVEKKDSLSSIHWLRKIWNTPYTLEKPSKSGNGIVMTVSNESFVDACHTLKSIQPESHQETIPVHIFYIDLDPDQISFLSTFPNVVCTKAESNEYRIRNDLLDVYAMLKTEFRSILFILPGITFTKDCSFLFSDSDFIRNGCLFWHNAYFQSLPLNCYKSYSDPTQLPNGQESSYFMLDTDLHFETICKVFRVINEGYSSLFPPKLELIHISFDACRLDFSFSKEYLFEEKKDIKLLQTLESQLWFVTFYNVTNSLI